MPNPTQIAVLGDSVTWGQGLLPPDKFANLIAAQYGLPPLAGNFMLAHSGAIIGVTNPDVLTAPNKEIPVPAPMITEQIGIVPNPGMVDLVLINGGINDIGIATIVNPLTSLKDLHNLTQKACYYDMKTLLLQVMTRFINAAARVCIIGYYPIISPLSNPFAGEIDLLVHLLGHFNVGFPQTLDHSDVLDLVSARTMQFWIDSTTYLQAAVNDAASISGWGNRLVFIPTTFSAGNAALLRLIPWLWGFAPDLGPEDEAAGVRGTACDLMYPIPSDLVPNEICHHASLVGHL